MPSIEDDSRQERRIAELEQRIAELDAFNYTIAHELRGPLQAISGFAGHLDQQEGLSLSPVGRTRLRRIAQAAAHMDRLIDDLLMLARADRMALVKEPVAVDEVVREILHELRDAYPGTRIVVSELPLVVADESVVRQVFGNVIGNALKYSGRQPAAMVEIGLAPDGSFSVVDNGIGFACTNPARMFMPFKRLTVDPAYPGTGVGLAVVWRLLARHGGWIEGNSREGGPTEFRFSFGDA